LLLRADDPGLGLAGGEAGRAMPRAFQLDPDWDASAAVGILAGTARAHHGSDFLERMRPVGDMRCLVGLPGLAWSPTPSALALLAAVGARVARGPSLDILRAVNGRPLVARLQGQLGLEHGALGKLIAGDLEQALGILARPALLGWLVRRCFGAAGRGRMRIEALGGARTVPSDGECAWLVASLRLGPLVLEPWVEITAEFTRSAWLNGAGRVSVSAPCLQTTGETGAWAQSERSQRDAIGRADDVALGQALELAGAALHGAGYSGPFGIDAFRHRVPGATGSSTVLNPISEINARYTMDWTCAMGSGAPDPGSDRDGDSIPKPTTHPPRE
jgi:hypothetical protein